MPSTLEIAALLRASLYAVKNRGEPFPLDITAQLEEAGLPADRVEDELTEDPRHYEELLGEVFEDDYELGQQVAELD